MTLYDRLTALWNDQWELNNLFRPDGPPTTAAGRIELIKEMTLHLMHECGSLLDANGTWKAHRRGSVPDNRARIGIELADIGKYWMTLCQINGFTADEMFTQMIQKSMVVRQRHAEEWVQELDRPSVIIDLDMVLADYIQAFVLFMIGRGRLTDHLGVKFTTENTWVDAKAVGMTEAEFQKERHIFRAEGGHANVPLMPGARAFLDWCVAKGWQIILLTSRPIDAYPNVYSDTIVWLDKNKLPYDRIWWATDKASLCIERGMQERIVFAVDDEKRYVQQFTSKGIRTFWMNPREEWVPVDVLAIPYQTPRAVKDLREIIQIWENEYERK